MTWDEFDKWWVVYSQFVGVYSKSGISFALNNVPGAQNSCKVRKNMVEMGYGNGPWQACPWVTLTPGQLYMTFQYSQTPLMLPAMQKPLQKAMKLTQI